MQKKQILRLVLIVAAVLAFFALSRRQMQPQQAEFASPAPPETEAQFTLLTDPPETPRPPAAPEGTPTPEETPLPEAGSYLELEDVAYYLHTYGHLPDNYITKAEAEEAGWKSYRGNLWDVAYGTSIGGDRYGNFGGQLPQGERYYEADVNYDGGYRGGERVVYTDDGDVWYTSDHYESFERLY